MKITLPSRFAYLRLLIGFCCLIGTCAKVHAQTTLNATYTTGTEVPLTSNGYSATGKSVNFTLSYAPNTGTQLMVVKNTSLGFISGSFSNLSQGQEVTLSYGGTTYRFVANYYGGSGNDLVLQWARTRVFAWGFNGFGQLGNNNPGSSYTPVATTTTEVLDGKTVFAVASRGYHSLALCSDGTLAAWGRNVEGQLGNNSAVQSNVPIAVTRAVGALMGKTVIAIATGELHSLALCSDGTLAAWGSNSNGQLGNNSAADSPVPVVVNTSGALAAKTIIAIAAGERHSLALCSDGTLAAWGWNIRGQLGNSSTTDSRVPVAVVTSGVLSGKTAIAVSAGFFFSLALCSDGTLVAWGENDFGQLGNNSTIHSSVPVAVNTTTGPLAGKTVVSVTGGIYHSLALCSDGTLAAWGRNYYGTLGNNSTINSSVPVAVTAATGALASKTAIAVSAGGHHNLVACADGTLVGWGFNNGGQLGNFDVQTNVPTALSTWPLAEGEDFIVGASGSLIHSLAIVAQTIAPPTVTAITPNSGSTVGGTSVTITGTGFTGATSVTVGGSQAIGFTVISDTSITATTPPGAAGPASVVVTNTTSGTSSANTLYTYLAPSIAVAQGGTELNDNSGNVDFGTVTNAPVPLTFTITNTGNQALTGLVVTTDGPSAADFTVGVLSGTNIPVGTGTVTFTVTFAPATAGVKIAALHIASNVTGAKNPFDVALTGQRLSSTQDTDSDGLNDAAEFDMATLGFKWDVSQPTLVSTLFNNANSAGLFTASQVQALNVGTPLLTQNPTTGKFTLTISVQKSTSLVTIPFTDFPFGAPDTTTFINGAGKLEFEFPVSDKTIFLRLQAQ